jgi:hypothetical protein
VARLSKAELLNRRNERRAARMTKRAADSFGPLFAHLAPSFTRNDAEWHNRFNAARGAESLAQSCGPAARGMANLRTRFLEGIAAHHCGPEVAARLKERAVRTFGPSYPQYAYGFWENVLTGQTIDLEYVRIEDETRPMKCRVEIITHQVEHPPYTRESFRVAFPPAAPEPLPEPDDAGLFARVLACFELSLPAEFPADNSNPLEDDSDG